MSLRNAGTAVNMVAIQTKTSSGNSFRLSVKDERPASRDHESYVLVSLWTAS
jgi:hypothetical protein